MNKYEEAVKISVMIDDREEIVPVNYMELSCLDKISQGMKQIEIGPALKRSPKTVYNVSCILRKKLRVSSNEELKELVKHVDFDKLLAWIFFAFITAP